MLKLYGFSRVNHVARGHTRDLRVLWALEEMQIPFELVGMDHPAGELRSDAFRALNPLQQIPVIDDDGVVLSESAAILLYLARKTGRFIPRDAAGDAQVVRWSFVAMNSLEIPLMALMMIDWVKDEPGGRHREDMVDWADRHLGNLESWLRGRAFVATAEFTVADILLAHVLTGVTEPRLVKAHPGVVAYRERCLARPAWQRTLQGYLARVQAA